MRDYRHKKEGQSEGQGGRSGLERRALKMCREAVIAIGFGGEHKESFLLTHVEFWTDDVVHSESYKRR